MEATTKANPAPRWFLLTSIAAVFWFVAYRLLQFLHHASDDPGLGFVFFLTVVFLTFFGLSYGLRFPASPAWPRHMTEFGVALLLFGGWCGIGFGILCCISAYTALG